MRSIVLTFALALAASATALVAAQAAPPPPGLDAPSSAPPPPPALGGPDQPGVRPPPPPPPPGPHVILDRGPNGVHVDVRCPERDTVQDCSTVATQLLDKLGR